jgi:hypothetical protein
VANSLSNGSPAEQPTSAAARLDAANIRAAVRI